MTEAEIFEQEPGTFEQERQEIPWRLSFDNGKLFALLTWIRFSIPMMLRVLKVVEMGGGYLEPNFWKFIWTWTIQENFTYQNSSVLHN